MLEKFVDSLLVEHEECLEQGRLFLFTRKDIFEARIYTADSDRRYLSLLEIKRGALARTLA